VTARGHKGTGGQVCASGGRWHTRAHPLTYAHQSAVTHHQRNCHATFRAVTPRWGCFSGLCPDVAAEGWDESPVTRPKNGLGAGDITALWRTGNHRLFQNVGTATYLLVELCLSQRRRAAGSERALVPVTCTVALGQTLGQRLRFDFETFDSNSVVTAAQLPSDRDRSHHPEGATPQAIAPVWGTDRGAQALGKVRTQRTLQARPESIPGDGR
jgi:hypothetical protein